MKNIFYVHSHITYFVSRGIIRMLNYENDEVLFIYSRNYKNPENISFNNLDVSKIHDQLNSYNFINFFKKDKLIRKVDDQINHAIGKDTCYRAYLPQVSHPILQIIASNKNCKELNIIEEGVNAYSEHLLCNKEHDKFKSTIKLLLNNVSFIGRGRIYFNNTFDLSKFIKDKSPNFYTITSKGFRHISHNVEQIEILPIQSINVNISDCIIIVLEGAVEQGNMHLGTMLDGVKKILNDIKAEKIYIKFHPVQNKENREKILNLISIKGFEVETIDDKYPFEQVILKGKNLKIYGFTTSLLFYAKEYGCEVFSYEDRLIDDRLFKSFRRSNNFDLKELL